MTLTPNTKNNHENHRNLALGSGSSTIISQGFLAQLENQARNFDAINLMEMESVALLSRLDYKFVFVAEELLALINKLQPDYRILSVQGRRLNHYRTLYFDSPEFELYRIHVNRQAERYKVRSREYTDTHLSFLEVKHHTRKQRTIKHRLQTSQPVFSLSNHDWNWLKTILPLDLSCLEPKLWNTFTRITLVGRRSVERVTLDTDISFFAEDHAAHLSNMAVVEVKMGTAANVSPLMKYLQSIRKHPTSFSKYVIGVSMLYDTVKKDKAQLQQLNKITGGLVHEFVS